MSKKYIDPNTIAGFIYNRLEAQLESSASTKSALDARPLQDTLKKIARRHLENGDEMLAAILLHRFNEPSLTK